MVFHASSISHHFSKSDEQLSFSGLTSISTPSKTDSRPHPWSVSSDSRCSMTPFETGLGGSLSIPSGTGICHGSLTPVTSVSGLQHVTSSGWHQAMSLSPLTLQGLDPLNPLNTKWFQTLCDEASHCTAVQVTAHEIVLSGCQACSTVYGVVTAIQQADQWESTLCGLCEEANKA